MKYSIPSILMILAVSASFCPDTHAQSWPAVVEGLKLEIGWAPVNSVHANIVGDLSGALGTGHDVSGYYSFAIGNGNAVSGVGSLSLGAANFQSGGYAASIGIFNYCTSQSSLTIGAHNNNWGGNSLIVGENNGVGNALSSATMGYGLLNDWGISTLVGQYNSTTLKLANIGPSLVVGCGTGAETQNRANSLEIYANGKIIINQAQGDILMGEFGN